MFSKHLTIIWDDFCLTWVWILSRGCKNSCGISLKSVLHLDLLYTLLAFSSLTEHFWWSPKDLSSMVSVLTMLVVDIQHIISQPALSLTPWELPADWSNGMFYCLWNQSENVWEKIVSCTSLWYLIVKALS